MLKIDKNGLNLFYTTGCVGVCWGVLGCVGVCWVCSLVAALKTSLKHLFFWDGVCNYFVLAIFLIKF